MWNIVVVCCSCSQLEFDCWCLIRLFELGGNKLHHLPEPWEHVMLCYVFTCARAAVVPGQQSVGGLSPDVEDSIGALQNLEILDLDSNQIAELPAVRSTPQLRVTWYWNGFQTAELHPSVIVVFSTDCEHVFQVHIHPPMLGQFQESSMKKVLGVSQNLLRSFEAGTLTRLEELRLAGFVLRGS